MRLFYSIFFLAIAASISFAQEPLVSDSVRHVKSSEVIVTGFPASNGEVPLPIPITTIPRAEIRAGAAFKELPALLEEQPSVVSYSQNGLNTGYVNLNIRGFDQRRESILINGVPQNDPEDHSVYWADIPDLSGFASKVELQRGAGSAFYGPPAIGGSINVETFPSMVREFSFSAMGGSFGTTKFSISANSGLVDGTYIASARLSQFHSDGYRNNDFLNMKSYYLSMAKVDEHSFLQVTAYGGLLNDALDYYGIPSTQLLDRDLRKQNFSEDWTQQRRPQEEEQFSQQHYELLSSIDLEKNVTLSNTFFYIKGEGYFDYDGSWPGRPHSEFYHLTPDYGFRYNFKGLNDTLLGNELVRGFVGSDQYGWLPRLEYKDDNGMFTAGGEIRIHRSNHWGQLLSAATMPVNLPGDYHFYDYKGGKDIYSGYLSENYSISKSLSASASIQLLGQTYHFFDEQPTYFDSIAAASQGQVKGFHNYKFDVPLFFVNPRIGITVVLSDHSMMFLSGSYTSRDPRLKDYYNAESLSSPRFRKRQDSTFDFSSPLIKPEHLTDIELGLRLKRLALDEDDILKATIGITGYYMPFSDELIETGTVDQWGAPIVANAQRVQHYGLEFEAGLSYTTILSLTGAFSVSHNEILEYSGYTDPIGIQGKTPIGFPSMIGSIALSVTPTPTLQLKATLRGVGSSFGDLENSTDFQNPAYSVVDLYLGYKFVQILGLSHVSLGAQVNNVFDELYTTYSIAGANGFFVGATRNAYINLEIGL